VLACLFLIVVVLLQTGKGGMGAAFGGASQTVFGARGAGSLLGKLTAAFAGVFMATSLTLAYLSTSKDESLREAAAAQEERAKARSVRSKGQKGAPAKSGAMSGSQEEGEGAAPADEGAPEEGAAPAAEGENEEADDPGAEPGAE
jgi:preprotein translocase subunit SecG